MFEESEFSTAFLDVIMGSGGDPNSVTIEAIHTDILDGLEGKLLSEEKARRIGVALETLDIIGVADE